MLGDMVFQSWADILRTLLVGTLAYIALVLLLRISGNRTLSKMYAFDLVITVALGSTLATILLSEDVALLEGVVALTLLIGLQFVLTWLTVRSQKFEAVVKSEPRLIFHGGDYLPRAMQDARVSHDVLRSALRQQGVTDMDAVAAVVLEPDGTFSIIRKIDEPAATLQGVRNLPPGLQPVAPPKQGEDAQDDHHRNAQD